MKHSAILGLLAAACVGTALAQEGAVPTGVPQLDHVFVIMMENHGYSQIINNPNAPFTNSYAKSANVATNYFGVAHPSLTNYLEIVGGSNFGIHTDNYPDWHNSSCVTNLASGIPATDKPKSPNVCPISGTGTDAATPAIDTTNEINNPGDIINNIDGVKSIPANPNTVGKTIADQLAARGMTWKSYQQNILFGTVDKVNYSDGVYSNLTDFSAFPTFNSGQIVALYAAKHNPFVYFQSVQEGTDPKLSYKQIVDFDGPTGLYADLASGRVPNFSFIAPNQCNDQHGRGNGVPFCGYDFNNDGTQVGLNPTLMYQGDVTLQALVTAIHKSKVWKEGKTAIVTVWDEDDYSISPTVNQVLTIVDTNYGVSGKSSNTYYNHFSLTKTIEGALGLPCLNHACDATTAIMSDLFAAGHHHDDHEDDNE